MTFACTDNLDPAPLCPAPVRVSTGPSVTVSASDWAGNSKSYTFGGINIDRVAPVVTAAVSPPPDPNGNNSFTATVNVTAFDPSGIRSITYSATGAQPIPPTTVTAIGSPATFSVAIALNAVGTTVLTVVATDGAGNVSPGTTVTVKIVGIQRSTLVITSPPTLPRRATLVTAKLTGPGAIPIAGRTVTFIAGRRTATGTTNASGVASATLALNRGTFILRAAFAGDPAFSASSAQSTLVVTRPKDDDNDRDNDDGDRDRANGRDPD